MEQVILNIILSYSFCCRIWMQIFPEWWIYKQFDGKNWWLKQHGI